MKRHAACCFAIVLPFCVTLLISCKTGEEVIAPQPQAVQSLEQATAPVTEKKVEAKAPENPGTDCACPGCKTGQGCKGECTGKHGCGHDCKTGQGCKGECTGKHGCPGQSKP